MRSLVVSGLILGLVGSAVAAPMKAKKKVVKTKAPAVVAPAAPVVAEPVVVAQAAPVAPAPAAVDTAAAPAANTSTSTVAAATTEVKKSKFSASIRSYTEIGMTEANRGLNTQVQKAGEIATEELRASYKLSDKVSLGLGQDIGHTWGTVGDNKSSVTIYDPFVQVAHSEIAKLVGDISTSGALRLYAPISERSSAEAQIAQVRAYLTFAKDLGNGFGINYLANPRYFIQRNTTYTDGTSKNIMGANPAYVDEATTPGVDKEIVVGRKLVDKATRAFRFIHQVELTYDPAPLVSLAASIGMDEVFVNGDSSRGIREEDGRKSILIGDIGAVLNVHKNAEVHLGVTTSSRDMLKQTNQFGFMREDESAYYAALKLKM